MTSGGEENVGATPVDSILGHLATYSRVWSPLSDVVLVCSDGLLPAHKLVLAALSPLLRSALAEADTWDETVSVVMPDFSRCPATWRTSSPVKTWGSIRR